MKEKILTFLKNVRDIFANRLKNMPNARFHKPFIATIQEDVAHLESAEQTMTQLDEKETSLFAASLLYYVMELIVPIFRRWRERMEKLALNMDVQSHQQAKPVYETQRDTLFALVEQMNTLAQPPLIATVENNPSGIAIIRAYQKEQYLKMHAIQEVTVSPEKTDPATVDLSLTSLVLAEAPTPHRSHLQPQ